VFRFELRYYLFLFYDSDISNIGEVPLRKNQTSQGFVASFETIYDGVPILAVFATNYHIQITDTGETYLVSHLFSHWRLPLHPGGF
jgi:hypothetical protein